MAPGTLSLNEAQKFLFVHSTHTLMISFLSIVALLFPTCLFPNAIQNELVQRVTVFSPHGNFSPFFSVSKLSVVSF